MVLELTATVDCGYAAIALRQCLAFGTLVAGIAVAGIFVVVESWLLHGDEQGRAKRLGIYMVSLYGGTALGQMAIGQLGVAGAVPLLRSPHYF